MGAVAARRVARRPRWRAYLLLARVSNLPTVWTNVLAGMLASQGFVDAATLTRIGLAVSLFYSGGMFLNDGFDADHDRTHRPERPIPAGDVTRREVLVVGGTLLAAGELLLVPGRTSVVLGALLATAIVLYDYRHKMIAWAPLVMGLCRGLVYLVASAASGGLRLASGVGAVTMTAYVVALTIVARLSGPKVGWRVPILLAGISLVDASFILIVSGSLSWALAAAAGFPLTLLLQRAVPGD
jgi:4-hydroxybenzoate polyprenyltransferase